MDPAGPWEVPGGSWGILGGSLGDPVGDQVRRTSCSPMFELFVCVCVCVCVFNIFTIPLCLFLCFTFALRVLELFLGSLGGCHGILGGSWGSLGGLGLPGGFGLALKVHDGQMHNIYKGLL